MELVTSTSRRALLSGPVACGCALVGAATYIAAHSAGGGGLLPPCPLHEMTGLWCPGCGLTRATNAILRGHVGAAFGYNVLFPFFLGAIALGWWAWMRSALGRAPVRWVSRLTARSGSWTGVVVFAVLLAFGVLRNLSPFHALAP